MPASCGERFNLLPERFSFFLHYFPGKIITRPNTLFYSTLATFQPFFSPGSKET
jgi:hypothetical protein